ncbi:MAG: dihydroorotase family protein [Candidatus Hydrothermarchaeales archaeon]
MLLKNCKIITSEKIILADILIEGEKITKIGRSLKDKEVINIRGRPVIPGLVDVHVHMRDFNQRYKEDFMTGSRAAIAGGVTTYLDMPNTVPPVVDEKSYKKRIDEAQGKSLADYGINFGITKDNLGELGKVDPAAYKVYLDNTLGEISMDALELAMQKCKRTIAFHAEDGEIIPKDVIPEEFIEYARIRGPEVELSGVKKVASLARELEKKVHLCHISLADSLEYLNEYTTCEVTPHHLFLNERHLKELEGFAKTNPPLRKEKDNTALLVALKDGRIDVVASDHAPHTISEKEGGPAEAPPGLSNLEVTLRLLLNLVNKGVITLNRLVEVACENPAKIFALKKGVIKEGMDADLVVVNMKEKGRIEGDEFYSKAKYTPFEGWRVMGGMDMALLRGKVVFEDGEVVAKRGYGKRAEIED